MWQIPTLRGRLGDLQATLLSKAQQHLEVIMPGYTHLQRAQPVLFSHWVMSYFWMLHRDQERLDDLEKRVSVLPLGAGALAGNALAVDREFLAQELGFARVSENSLDAVSDRDFVAEFLFWATLLQGHLSRLAEDLIVWSTAEFGFVELDDSYSTGSSLMPQKKNPDSMELLRGKSGRMLGHLVALLTTLKGLPSAYNKDLQEDKEPLFDAIDTLKLALPVAAGTVSTLRIHPGAMAAALDDSMLATDLADYLVRKGVPFRQSHELVGKAVRKAEATKCTLRDLPLSEYQALSGAFDEDLREVFDFQRSVDARSVRGGTGVAAVRAQIERAKAALGEVSEGATIHG
jgi:argininosuccinate lyase